MGFLSSIGASVGSGAPAAPGASPSVAPKGNFLGAIDATIGAAAAPAKTAAGPTLGPTLPKSSAPAPASAAPAGKSFAQSVKDTFSNIFTGLAPASDRATAPKLNLPENLDTANMGPITEDRVGESPVKEASDASALSGKLSGTDLSGLSGGAPGGPVKDPNAMGESTPQQGAPGSMDTLGMLSYVTKAMISLPAALIGQELHPSPDELSDEQFAGMNKTPGGLPEALDIGRWMSVGTMRFWRPLTEKFANDFADAMLANKVAPPGGAKQNTPMGDLYNLFFKSGSGGKDVTIDDVMRLPAMQKTATQIVGDTAQVVLAAYTPALVGEGVAAKGSQTILSAMLDGAKTSALNAGVPFAVSQVMSEGTTDPKRIADIFFQNVMGMATLGAITHAAPVALDSLTHDVVTEYGLPKTVNFNADEVYNVYAGLDNTSDRRALLMAFNLTNDEVTDAAKNGISITIPGEKITTVMDRPWWGAIKNSLNLKATFEQTIESSGGRANTPFGGYLPEKAASAEKDIASSESFDVQGAIKSGDIERTDIYKDATSDVLKPEAAQGRIDDIAQKLDKYEDGLGDKFRGMVDPENVTMKGNVPEGLVKTATDLIESETGDKVSETSFLAISPEGALADHAAGSDLTTDEGINKAIAEARKAVAPKEEVEPDEVSSTEEKTPAAPSSSSGKAIILDTNHLIYPKYDAKGASATIIETGGGFVLSVGEGNNQAFISSNSQDSAQTFKSAAAAKGWAMGHNYSVQSAIGKSLEAEEVLTQEEGGVKAPPAEPTAKESKQTEITASATKVPEDEIKKKKKGDLQKAPNPIIAHLEKTSYPGEKVGYLSNKNYVEKIVSVDSLSLWPSRTSVDEPRISKMKEAIKNGEELPPPIITDGGGVSDGHHRVAAYRDLGIKEIKVLIPKKGKGTGQIDTLKDAEEKQLLKKSTKENLSLPIKKAALTGSMSDIESHVTKYVAENAKDLANEYRSKHGNVFNVDNMKELLPGHSENRTISEAFHKPAAVLMGEMVRKAIMDPANKDKDVFFMAGAPASGKSSAVGNTLDKEVLDNAAAIIDGTLASDRSINEIRQALNAGHEVHVYYIESTPEQILQNAVRRANGGGRTVPVETIFNALQKSRQNLFRAEGKFGDNPKFDIHVIDNSEVGNPHLVSDALDFIRGRIYSKDDIARFKEEAYQKLDSLYEEGKITKQVHEGFSRRKGEAETKGSLARNEGGKFAGEESAEEHSGKVPASLAKVRNSVSERTPRPFAKPSAIPAAPTSGAEDQVGEFSDFQKQNPKLYTDLASIAPREPEVKGEKSMQLNAEIIPGLEKVVTEDLMPGAKNMATAFKAIGKEIATFFNPVGQADPKAVDIIMRHKGEFERYIFRMERSVMEIKKMWDKQPEAARLDFMAKIEAGENIEPKLQPLADMYRERLDNAHTLISKYKDVNFLENFFPHFWEDKDQEAVEKKFVPGMIAKRPLQGPRTFLKERVFETLQKGIEAGYKPVSTNPEELMQVYETNVQKFLMAQRIKEDMIEKGMWKFVTPSDAIPADFARINDSVSHVYYKESKTLQEFFDHKLMTGLEDLAKNLGIAHERVMKIRGKREAAGKSITGQNKIQTRFGSPESVFMHELGHQIDERYGLKDKLVANPEYKEELRALADRRMGDLKPEEVDPNFRAYVRKGEEKMAVMFESYLHAPEVFKEVAPKTYQWFVGFMGSHYELRPILNLRPSLMLGGRELVLEGPMIKAGEYWAQKDVARLINNHLSKDWIYSTALGTGFMNVKNTMNAFQLGLSAFHLSMETIDSIVTEFSMGLSQVASGKFMSGFKNMIKAPSAPYAFVKSGQGLYNNDPSLLQLEKDIFTGGASLRSKQYYKNTVFDTFTKNMREGNFLGAAFRAPIAAVEGTMRPLFNFYIPRLKVGAFRALMASELERPYNTKLMEEGKLTREQLARQVWNNIENRMGEINYDNLFWNRTAKSAAMLMFRSVGWNLGTIREIGGAAFKDLPSEAYNAFKGKGFNFTPKMAYTMSLFFVMGTIGAIFQFLHTGKLPQQWLDLYYPQNGATNAQGEAQRVQFPSYLKDIWQYSHDPLKTISDKFAPEFAALIELWSNKDFYGDNIRNTNDNLPTQAKQVGLFILSQLVPFTFANINQQIKGNTGMTQRVESFFGIMNAPRAAVQTDWESYLSQLYTDQVGASGPKTPEQKAVDAEKAKVRQQIQNGDTSGVKELETMGIIKPTGAKQFIADAKLTTEQRMYKGLSKDNRAKFVDQFPDQVKSGQLQIGTNGIPAFADGTRTTPKNIVNVVWNYATAFGADPSEAFHLIFSGQTISTVDHGVILVDRMSLNASEGIKRNMAIGQGISTSGYQLDHVVELSVGGTNDKGNLQLITDNQDQKINQPIEDFVRKEFDSGTISGEKAREIMIRFKAGQGQPLTPELQDEFKNKYGGVPLTAQEIYNSP